MVCYCDECGGKIALCTNYCSRDFEPDQEPFENGVIEDIEEVYINDGFMIIANICVNCKKVHDAHLSDSFKPRETMLDKPKNDAISEKSEVEN